MLDTMVNIQPPDYLALTVFVILMIIFPLGLIGSGKLMGPSKPSPEKNSTYECGQVAVGPPHMRFNIRYYPYAMIYAVFGAIAIFLLITGPAILTLGAIGAYIVIITLAVIIMSLISAMVALRPAKERTDAS